MNMKAKWCKKVMIPVCIHDRVKAYVTAAKTIIPMIRQRMLFVIDRMCFSLLVSNNVLSVFVSCQDFFDD